MRLSVRFPLAPFALLLAAAGLHAQSAPLDDVPKPFVPLKPATRPELDRVEARKLYGLGVLHERHSRLLEAIKTFEEARRLDPEAAPVHVALIPLYFAIDRTDEALTACRRAMEINPDDFDTAYLFARQLKGLGRPSEALDVLAKAAARPALKEHEHADSRLQICYDLGLLHESAGHLDQAETALREAAAVLENPGALLEQGSYLRDEIEAQAAETYERIGQICLKAGNADRAVEAFEKAQKKDPGRAARLAFHLAKINEARGKPKEALAQVEEYLRAQPLGTEGYELEVRLLKKLDRTGDVLPALEAASGRDKHNRALKLLLAREYRRAELSDKAEAIYNLLVAESPGADTYRALFDYLREDRADGANRALTMLDEAVAKASPPKDKEKGPGDANAAAKARAMLLVLREKEASDLVRGMLLAAHQRLIGKEELDYGTRLLLAPLADRARQLDLAERLYRSCLERPGGPGDLEHEVYHGLLRVLWQAHKYEEVIKICKQGLQKAVTTNRVLFHVDLAQAYAALDRSKEALASANDAVDGSSEKERLFCRRNRVEILSQIGQYDKAIAECQELLKEYNQAGDVRDVRLTLCNVYSAAREYAKAEEQLRLILTADPDDATANNDLGYQWADQSKNLEEAERLIRKALELDRRQRNTGTTVGLDADRDNAAYVDSLGWVLFRRGKLDDARREMEKAASLPGGDDDPVVWDHLGDVYFRMELPDKAAEAWKKAVSLYDAGRRRKADGRYREIKQKLKLLEP